MQDGPLIVSKGGMARGLLPFHSLDQALFSILLVAACFGIISAVDPSNSIGATIAGTVGAWVMSYSTRPAYLVLGSDKIPALISTLEEAGYRYEAKANRWVPNLPRWLRWSYNFVRVEQDASGGRVYGPADQLRRLAQLI